MASTADLHLMVASYFSCSPRRIKTASSGVGSPTVMGWKRRSSAASFSMCLRIFIQCCRPDDLHLSPRVIKGLMMLAASMEPSAAPAPITVCNSSIKSSTLPALYGFVKSCFQALLEFAAVFGIGHHAGQPRGDHTFVLEKIRQITFAGFCAVLRQWLFYPRRAHRSEPGCFWCDGSGFA